MICSKCKIISIHLPKFDSYICEFGHVFCRSCSPKPYSPCSICNGRIVRRAELLIEGVPRTIFHQTPNEDCNQMSDADSEIKMQDDSDSDENWSRMFDYRDSEDYHENVACSPRGFACRIIASQINAGNCEFPKRVASNQDTRDQYSYEQLKQRRSNYQFKSPSSESVNIESTSHIRDDPKNLYMKTCGKVPPSFDPKKDYFERIAQVNTIHEYYKQPNLLMGTKSSSKVEIRMADSNMSDSSTVIQHLTEFRKATNYVPPSNVSAYKVNNNETMSEPAIITTSKTGLPTRNGPRIIFAPSKQQAISNANEKSDIQTLFVDSRDVGLTNGGLKKVDVGTMMDICLLSSASPPTMTSNHLQHELQQECSMSKGQINETKAFQEVVVNLVKPTITENVEQSEKAGTNSLRSLLREQLRNQVYSQFNCAPKKPKNTFMMKGSYSPNDTLPARCIQVTTITKVNKLPDARNIEVEKALKNLTTFPNLQFNGNQRRDEIVKQSKKILRQRIMQEVYSRFEKCQTGQHSNGIDTDATAQENNVDVLQQKEDQEDRFVSSAQQEAFISIVEPDTHHHEDHSSKTQEATSREYFNQQDKRSVAMSTESYPKLNPDLNLILPSKCSTQKSTSFYCPRESIDGLDHSVLKQTSVPPMSNTCDDSEKDMVDEILHQFQRNVTVTSCQNIFNVDQPQNIETNEYEQVLRIDQLSPNVIYDQNEAQQATFSKLDVKINGGTPLIDETRSFQGPTIQSLGDGHLETQKLHQNVYFFHQCKPFSFAAPSPTHPLTTSIGDDYNVNMKTVARNLVDDYREKPKNTKSIGILGTNQFITYIKEKFPNISLKQLKEIIVNIPTDEADVEDLIDIPIWFPPPAALRSEYEKLEDQEDRSDNLPTDQTKGFLSPDYPTKFSLSTIITAWRAYFCPPIDIYAEPIPQLKPVSKFNAEVSIIEHLPRGLKAAAELNLSRNPITCPVTSCSKLIFVSEFSKHIKMDHVKVPVETLAPGRCKNLFLDPRIDEYGVNKCHILYLVTDKIRDLGSKEFKDYLPLLVMATRVSLLQLISPLCNPLREEMQSSRQSYLMIWMTGLRSQDLPVYFSLTAWHRYSTTPKCHIVHSGRIYSIRNKHDDRSVFNSGNAMLLSQSQIQLLTNNGQDMIELQIIVH